MKLASAKLAALSLALGATVLTMPSTAESAPGPAPTADNPCGDLAARPWCDASLDPDTRANRVLKAMTLQEKISLLAGDELTGVAGLEGTHTGTSNGVERLGIPSLYFSDGPVGTRQGKATGMPSSIAVAASFDPAAAFQHAATIGDEARRKGNDVVYAPTVNIMRTPVGGRTFEGFGEDPYLAGRTAVGWVRGIQSQGVIANIKHYALNNQEGGGSGLPTPIAVPAPGSRMTVDVRASERAMREIYLPAFESAVKAGVGTVMCAYNRVNGQFACENEHLLTQVLKKDWGFKGFVLTDYAAAKNPVASLNNGLDLDIFPGVIYNPLVVNAALLLGQVSTTTVDEHVRRILRTMFAFGVFDRTAYAEDPGSIDQQAHHAAAAAVEAQGIVLMKNSARLLPLKVANLRTVAVIGPEGDKLKDGGGSSAIDEFLTTTPLQALRARLGSSKVVYDDGSNLARAAQVAKAADVAIVVVGDNMTEGADKSHPTLNSDQLDVTDRDALITAVNVAQPRTVTVLQTGGPVLTPWRSQVTTLVEMWYPGQNGGTALTKVLFGDVDPSGRLPATFPRSAADLPTAGDPEKYPGVLEVVHYKEDVLVGYRWFDAKRLPVAFPFGHGLSYTTFGYSNLRVDVTSARSATVRFAVTNTGSRRGSAVPQLYVSMPRPGTQAQAPRQLKGFQKVSLAPGETRTITLRLDSRALSYWSTTANGWRVQQGCYGIDVGTSSRDLVLSARRAFNGGAC